MVRLRDLGGGEPNDDLTWALFDEEVKGGQVERALDRDPAAANESADAEVDRSAARKESNSGNRGARGRPRS